MNTNLSLFNLANLLIMPNNLDTLILVLFLSVVSLGLATILFSRKKIGQIATTVLGIGATAITTTDSGLNIYDRLTGGKSKSDSNNNSGNNGDSSNNGNSNNGDKSNNGSDNKKTT